MLINFVSFFKYQLLLHRLSDTVYKWRMKWKILASPVGYWSCSPVEWQVKISTARKSQIGYLVLGWTVTQNKALRDYQGHLSPSFALCTRANYKSRDCRQELLDALIKPSGRKDNTRTLVCKPFATLNRYCHSSNVMLTFHLFCAQSSRRSHALSCSVSDKREEIGMLSTKERSV